MNNMNKKPSVDNSTKTPFMLRLKAWWHGYDIEDFKANLSKNEGEPSKEMEKLSTDSSKNSNKSSVEQEEPEEGYHFEDKPVASYPEADDEDLGDGDINTNLDSDSSIKPDSDFDLEEDKHEIVKAVWDTDRAHVAQLFWGDGYCGPGGPDNIISMTAELGINSRRKTMVVSAGLGGPVRAIQKEYDTTVDGYEPSEQLAKDGMEMSLKAGVAENAPILHHELENCIGFNSSYDRVYVKEALFIINEKSQLIQAISNHLKEDGIVLLTDYVVTEDTDQESALFKKWRTLEPYEPKPESSEFMENCFTESGLTIRSSEDLTGFYLHLISKTRKHARTVLAAMEAEDLKDINMIKYMHNEAVLWDTRAKLLESGDLKVFKYLCNK